MAGEHVGHRALMLFFPLGKYCSCFMGILIIAHTSDPEIFSVLLKKCDEDTLRNLVNNEEFVKVVDQEQLFALIDCSEELAYLIAGKLTCLDENEHIEKGEVVAKLMALNNYRVDENLANCGDRKIIRQFLSHSDPSIVAQAKSNLS